MILDNPISQRNDLMADLGMPTLIELPHLEDCAALCHELGLQFMELNMNLPQYQINKFDIKKYRELARKYNIYYTIHLDENLNISDFNPYVADAYRQTVLDTINTAKELSIPILNMHLSNGVYFTLPHKKVFLFEEYKDIYLTSIQNFRAECESAIDGRNITICIENSDGYSNFQTDALTVLLESPVFALTFDIGHNYGIGGMDEPVILSHKEHLRHFHFHDALGRANHLALGTGEIDLEKYYRIAYEHQCRIVLETKTVDGLMQSVEWIKNFSGCTALPDTGITIPIW